jgi:hypothetical protein
MSTSERWRELYDCPVCGVARGIVVEVDSPDHAWGRIRHWGTMTCGCSAEWELIMTGGKPVLRNREDWARRAKYRHPEHMWSAAHGLRKVATFYHLLEQWAGHPEHWKSRKAQHAYLRSSGLYKGGYKAYCDAVNTHYDPKDKPPNHVIAADIAARVLWVHEYEGLLNQMLEKYGLATLHEGLLEVHHRIRKSQDEVLTIRTLTPKAGNPSYEED